MIRKKRTRRKMMIRKKRTRPKMVTKKRGHKEREW